MARLLMAELRPQDTIRPSVEVAGAESLQVEGDKFLRETLVRTIGAMPGLVTAYWLRSDDQARGISVSIFESEEAARAAAENRPTPPEGAPITITRFELMSVIAQA